MSKALFLLLEHPRYYLDVGVVTLMHLINVALPELISDENFIVDRAGLLCNGAIKPFWLGFGIPSRKQPPLFSAHQRCQFKLISLLRACFLICATCALVVFGRSDFSLGTSQWSLLIWLFTLTIGKRKPAVNKNWPFGKGEKLKKKKSKKQKRFGLTHAYKKFMILTNLYTIFRFY